MVFHMDNRALIGVSQPSFFKQILYRLTDDIALVTGDVFGTGTVNRYTAAGSLRQS